MGCDVLTRIDAPPRLHPGKPLGLAGIIERGVAHSASGTHFGKLTMWQRGVDNGRGRVVVVCIHAEVTVWSGVVERW
jgi:hypothetical protein